MSNLSQFLGSAGKGNPLYNELVFVSSRTWVTPVKGRYLLTAIGAGGSGAYYTSGSSGGAGGIAQSLVELAAGVTLTLTCGAGGAQVSTQSTLGNTGGTSSISGSGFTTLTANGGGAGTAVVTTALSAGGTASGGNIMNVTGGQGGKGGGAVGVYGESYSGNTTVLAGAGTGGPPATAVVSSVAYPGTALFSGDDIRNNVELYFEAYVNPVIVMGGSLINGFKNGRLLLPNGGFAYVSSGGNSTSGPGCGAGGNVSGGAATSIAGMFSGGISASTYGVQLFSQGGAFGGGGGAQLYSGSGAFSGKGGCGGVIIEYMYTP